MRDEKKLIRRMKHRQDREAANELISRYYQEIFAYVYRQTGERELSLDLAQEIFLAVLRGINGFDEKKAEFRTWLYRIASNKVTDYYRSKYHRQKKKELSLFGGREEESGEFEVQSAVINLPGEEDILAGMIRKETIRRVMELATEYDRGWIAIFQRRIFLEHSFVEIARELELPESTVKTRFYQMLQGIREEMRWDEES